MKDDKFKKLTRNIDLDEPSPSFTDDIMKMVEAETEIRINPALLSVIENELLSEPSFGFSDNLMAHIQSEEIKISDPLISKKVGFIILGIGIAILLLVLTTPQPGLKDLSNNSYFSDFGLNLSGTTMVIIKIATSGLPYLIPISILLVMDYFLRTRQYQLTSREHDD